MVLIYYLAGSLVHKRGLTHRGFSDKAINPRENSFPIHILCLAAKSCDLFSFIFFRIARHHDVSRKGILCRPRAKGHPKPKEKESQNSDSTCWQRYTPASAGKSQKTTTPKTKSPFPFTSMRYTNSHFYHSI